MGFEKSRKWKVESGEPLAPTKSVAVRQFKFKWPLRGS